MSEQGKRAAASIGLGLAMGHHIVGMLAPLSQSSHVVAFAGAFVCMTVWMWPTR